MLRPALPVAGTGEHPVDEPFPGIGALVREEGLDLFLSGREPEQIVAGAADQFSPAGLGSWSKAGGVELGEHEPVDFIASPGTPFWTEAPESEGVEWPTRRVPSR